MNFEEFKNWAENRLSEIKKGQDIFTSDDDKEIFKKEFSYGADEPFRLLERQKAFREGYYAGAREIIEWINKGEE